MKMETSIKCPMKELHKCTLVGWWFTIGWLVGWLVFKSDLPFKIRWISQKVKANGKKLTKKNKVQGGRIKCHQSFRHLKPIGPFLVKKKHTAMQHMMSGQQKYDRIYGSTTSVTLAQNNLILSSSSPPKKNQKMIYRAQRNYQPKNTHYY